MSSTPTPHLHRIERSMARAVWTDLLRPAHHEASGLFDRGQQSLLARWRAARLPLVTLIGTFSDEPGAALLDVVVEDSRANSTVLELELAGDAAENTPTLDPYNRRSP